MKKAELVAKVRAHRKPIGSMKLHELEDYARRHHLHISLMNKDEVINMVRISKCKMLQNLPIEKMTREEIIEHLYKSDCPELKKYF